MRLLQIEGRGWAPTDGKFLIGNILGTSLAYKVWIAPTSTFIISLVLLCSAAMAQDDKKAPVMGAQALITLSADAAEQHGTMLATTRAAYTGSSYITGFDAQDDHATWHFHTAADGVYAVEIRYGAFDRKGYSFAVDGVSHDDMFPPTGDAFATRSAGKVELKAGDHTFEIQRGWGFFDIDRIELIPTKLPEFKAPPLTLADSKASPAAKNLMKMLVDEYGKKTFSGVVSPQDAQLIHQTTGVFPAIMGGDLMDYSPSRLPFNPKSDSPPERLLNDAKQGYILTVMWHWNAPDKLINKKELVVDGNTIDASWYRGFYTTASTFDVEAALNDPNGNEYKLILRDIDAIALQLKKFDTAGVPVLWRPLHEADGKWFWWGAKGPDAFKRLWSLMFDRLTNHHHLHNLIWVYTGSTEWDWYPPADQFDIIGVDAYPKDARDSNSAIWDQLQARWGSKKLIALAEYGGVPDLTAMATLGVRWSYFASWNGDLGPAKVSKAELERLYKSPTIANRSSEKSGEGSSR